MYLNIQFLRFSVFFYFENRSSKVSYWARNGGGGGHLGVTVFATGGGGGDTKNFFEKLIVFGVLARAVENAKNYRLFEKFFRVPPVANTVTPKCPPPRCVPSKTHFWQISEFFDVFW